MDAPEYLQLHASLDLYSSLPYSVAEDQSSSASTIFWLDRRVVGTVIDHILKHQLPHDDGRKRRIKEIHDEDWDLFLRVLADGSIVVTAVAVRLPKRLYVFDAEDMVEYRPEATHPSSTIHLTTIATLRFHPPSLISLPLTQPRPHFAHNGDKHPAHYVRPFTSRLL